MRIFRYVLLSIFICLSATDATAQQPLLKFNSAGKFKIVQFTDVHYIYSDPRSEISIVCINEVLDRESPDLVIFTGDLIFGTPAEDGLRHLLKQVSDRKIPFAVLFGNHDDEYELSRKQLFEIIKTIPYSVTSTVDGLSGVSNYILSIRSSKSDNDAALLYCFDSHSYSQFGGYDFVKFDQIEWYRARSSEYRKGNGGTPLFSLAFLHIPLPEYSTAASDESAVLIGTRKEKSCPPDYNSGLFTSFKEMGDVKGVFVGHDHDNDYAVLWKGVLLAYGRYTGGNTVYNNLSNGARVIELTEGEEVFTSWIRLKGGEIVNRIYSPTDFIRKKN